MARPPRIGRGGIAYHVMNRTWGKIELFEDAGDYAAFERVLAEAAQRFPAMRLCAYCLMPNHFHLVLWPKQHQVLSRYMQWLSQTHVARWHAHRDSRGRGHLYQGRFKSFPVEENGHFLQVCRYVERNPLRAKLVRSAPNWRHSSFWARQSPKHPLHAALSPWPVALPKDWVTLVNAPQDERELTAIRRSRDRGAPYGDGKWALRTARMLSLASTLRPIGRPRKAEKARVRG